MHLRTLLVLGLTLAVVGCGDGEVTPQPPPSETNADREAIAEMTAAPGAIADRAPAGTAIPGVRTWEVHVASAGYTVVGADDAELPKVTFYFPLRRDGDRYELNAFGYRIARDLRDLDLAALLDAAATDLAARAAGSGANATVEPKGVPLLGAPAPAHGPPVTLVADSPASTASCAAQSAAAKPDLFAQYKAASDRAVQFGFGTGLVFGFLGGGVAACLLLLH